MKPESTANLVIEDEYEGLPAEGSAQPGVVVVDDEGEEKKAKLPARAVQNQDGSITLPLLKPVTLTVKTGRSTKEEVYTELVFHEMAGLDLRLIAQASAEKQTIVALARATRMSTPRMDALFDLMKAKDVTAAAAVIEFLQE